MHKHVIRLFPHLFVGVGQCRQCARQAGDRIRANSLAALANFNKAFDRFIKRFDVFRIAGRLLGILRIEGVGELAGRGVDDRKIFLLMVRNERRQGGDATDIA